MRLLLLALLLPFTALAEPTVSVLWRIQFTSPTGAGIFTEPSAAYLQTLRGCGFSANLYNQVNYLPIRVLRCPGVLDFSTNATVRARLDARIRMAQEHGHKAVNGISLEALRASLKTIDFAISPYGVFFSAQDGPGDARRVALNVEQVRLVILNKVYWAQLVNAPDADALLAHEALGALGKGDTDYQLSNTLFMQSRTDHTPGDGDEATAPVASASEGGGSVVGRGGDPTQQLFKASLLLAAEKQIQLEGVDQRFVPTKEELRQTINQTMISTAKPEFFQNQQILCQDNEGKVTSKFYCGHFILNGAQGIPFLVITRQWAEFAENDRYKLLLKIFQEIVTQLVKAKLH